MRSSRALAVLVLCTGMAVLHTWPLAADPAGQSRLDNADTALNTWIVSWVAHQLPRAPLQLFDAPMFHPERRTLAYSEPLLVPGVMAIPLRAAGMSATLTYNLLVVAGFALSAWAMWLLVAAWTGDAAAGSVAGLAFAFNAYTLTHFGQLQALHLEGVPVVLLGVDRIVTRGRVSDAVLFAAGLAIVGATSLYLLVFTAAATVVALLARVPEWRHRPARFWRTAALGIGLGGLLLAPVLLPYWLVHRDVGLERSLEETARYGAGWRDYLASTSRLHLALWSARFGSPSPLFPGLTVLALALVALAHRHVHRGRVRMLAAIAVLGGLLSLGPAFPLYTWLYDMLPILGATRVAARWGALVVTATAVLAGLGVAALRARARPAVRAALAVVVPCLVTLEALRAPMAYTPTPPIPAVYAHLAALPRAVLLEFPLFPASSFNLNAPYLVAQTTHFHPIVAGYSGFAPPGFDERLRRLGSFPSEDAHAEIRALGITHVVLHVEQLRPQFGQAAIDAIDQVPWLTRDFTDDEARVYAVQPQRR